MRKTYQDLIIHFLKKMTTEYSVDTVDIYIDVICSMLVPFPLAQKDFTNRVNALTLQRDKSLKDVKLNIDADKVFYTYWEECIKATYDVLALHNLLPRDMTNPYYQKEAPKQYQRNTKGRHTYHLRDRGLAPSKGANKHR